MLDEFVKDLLKTNGGNPAQFLHGLKMIMTPFFL